MKITKELVNRIGLDRVVIAGFRIIRIDYEKLLKHENVTLDKEGQHMYMLECGNSFRFLKIKDHNKFGIMCAGTKKTKYMKQDYSRMDIEIGDKSQGNLQNKTVEEYKSRIIQIFQYLYDEYGIAVDLQYLRFSEMEINCTFEIKEEFYKYHRVLRLAMFNLPKSYKKLNQMLGVNYIEQRYEAETFYRGNSSMQIKIYDKKKHLIQTKQIKVNEHIMRIEFILKKTQKIREVFGTSLVFELTDEKVNDFYYSQFIRLIEKPYRKWQIKNKKQLEQLIVECRSKSKHYWKSNLLRECSNKEQENQIPLLLDVEDLLAQVKIMEKNGHYTRIKAGILEQCKYNNIYLKNDAEKMEEIIRRVHEAYNNNLNRSKDSVISYSPINGEVA